VYPRSLFQRRYTHCPWHWENPKYTDLEKYSTENPPLFGFLYNISSYIPPAQSNSELPIKVDQKCLSTYARYNLLADKIVTTTIDQSLLGRYTKSVKDYYQDILSENINEMTGQVVKWREYGLWPYLLTPLSISFWIGGCGEPCYVCSYKGHFCIGSAERALNLTIYGLDQFWITDKADKGNLWPSDKFLVDYYGTINRGPEPIIGWLEYIVLKNATCSYCGCILFCILAQCIDPWFIQYSAAASVITFNSSDGIPQKLPGRFIEYVESLKKQLAEDDVEKKPLHWDHFPQERLFIDGKVDYYTAQIFNPNGLDSPPSGYLLGSQLDKDAPGSEIVGQDYIYLGDEGKFAFATITKSSGYHKEEKNSNGEQCTDEDKKNKNCQSETKDSIFFGFRTKGAADDQGYFIRNVAVKYYDHNVRKDIFKYNWLYVDIPNPLRTEVTPAITSFDSFDTPDIYFDDIDPLVIMRKNVYFKTILSSGDIVLNGDGSSKMNVSKWTSLFSEIDYNDRYYPFLWIDRIEKKIVKSPYNLYYKSGTSEFKECLLGEMLYDLEPGRYYFPNPYACAASPRMAPYDGNIHGGMIGRDYWVHDYDNHKKYFSTDLPMQFLGVTGENVQKNKEGDLVKNYKAILQSAKKTLGDPEKGSFAITSLNNESFYSSGPIEEFPTLSAATISNVDLIDWKNTGINWYNEGKFNRKKMLEDQKGAFLADLRNYNKKWSSGFNF
jgi:hypothetical protein